MSAQVFISYSNQDRAVAESIHDALEKSGIAAWLSHRDLTAGVPWSQRIIDEIHASRVMIVVLSRHANESQYVLREVAEAVERHAAIVTVRIEDVAPSKGLKFFIAAEQWLDAFALPKDQMQRRLVEDVRLLLAEPAPPTDGGMLPVTSDTRKVAPLPAPADDGFVAWLRVHRGGVAGVLASIVILVIVGMKVMPMLGPDVVMAVRAGQRFVGDSVQLVLESAHDRVVWSSSNPEVVAISPDSSVARALTAGTAVLRAQAGRKADSVTLTVVAPPVGSIAIQPPPAAGIRVGDSWQFGVAARDINGRDIPPVAARWSSETPRIVSVDEQGNALAIAVGRGRVRVRVDTLTAIAEVAIVAAPTRGTGPVRPADSGRVTTNPQPTRDSTQIDEPLPPAAPTSAQLINWANLCLDKLKAADAQWIENNFHPPTAAEQAYLDRLKNIMSQRGYQITASGMDVPAANSRAFDFWVRFSYSRFTGGVVRGSATFRVLADNGAGVWRLGSCRTTGPIQTS